MGEESYPVAAGVFRGSLALLLAQQGEFHEAQNLLDLGEPQVCSYPEELSKFLCKKVRIRLLQRDIGAARLVLKQVQDMARELDSAGHSEVGRALAELQALLPEDRA